MKDFKHPHVLGLLGVSFDTPDLSPYIILPFMANGSVKTYLRAKRVHLTNFDDYPVVGISHTKKFHVYFHSNTECNPCVIPVSYA